jgi:alpha-mannosidase
MSYLVPEALQEDRAARFQREIALPVVVRVTLTPGVRRIDFETTVENYARDHRLRVHFPAPLDVDVACAEGHWDVVSWSLDLPQDTEGWVEQPEPTHPQLGWASISDRQRGLTLANRGLPEVEVVRAEEGVEIALTLLRCVGWLSRDDMHCRKGHAGPEIEVPEAQCAGMHTFRYALIPHAGDWRAAVVEAGHFQSDLRAVATGGHSGSLPASSSFVRVDPEELRVSAVKSPEQGDGLIVRLWNVEDRPIEGTVRLWQPFAQATRVDMAEREIEVLARDASAVALSAGRREVITLRFDFER